MTQIEKSVLMFNEIKIKITIYFNNAEDMLERWKDTRFLGKEDKLDGYVPVSNNYRAIKN